MIDPERRAELRSQATSRSGCNPIIKQGELLAFLDATEPVADAEVAQWVALFQGMFAGGEMWADKAAFLIARMARELAEARKQRVGVDRVARIPFGPPEDED